jgi:hypothetical protein
MIYDDIIILNQHGGSRCFIIPSKWLKEHSLERLKFAIHLHIEGKVITIEPAEGRYLANQVAKGGQIEASPIHLGGQDETTKET